MPGRPLQSASNTTPSASGNNPSTSNNNPSTSGNNASTSGNTSGGGSWSGLTPFSARNATSNGGSSGTQTSRSAAPSPQGRDPPLTNGTSDSQANGTGSTR